MNLYQTKIYLTRLWNAIIWKEFKEGRYHWSLYDYILELVVEFIDGERCWYSSSYTEKWWEVKLKEVKDSILQYQEFDMNWLSKYQKNWGIDIKWYNKQYQELQREVVKWITDIFFNLWD